MYQSHKTSSRKIATALAVGFLVLTTGGMLVNTAFAKADNHQNTPPKLTVIKHVVNDNGGTGTASQFTLVVTTGEERQKTIATFSGNELGTVLMLSSNEDSSQFTVGEPSHAGYTVSYSGDCDSKGRVSINNNQNKTCTVTNKDIPNPENTLLRCSDGIDNDGDKLVDLGDPDCAAFLPTLTVTKVVVGGTKVVSDFPLFVTDNDNDDDDASSSQVQVTSGVAHTFDADTFEVSEINNDVNYIASYSGDCANESHSISLVAGAKRSCTITNTYVPPIVDVCPNIAEVQTSIPDGDQLVDGQCVSIAPVCADGMVLVSNTCVSPLTSSTTGYITVTKVVVGGTKVVSDFPLFVTDNDNDDDDAGSAPVQVTSGIPMEFDQDTYVISETNTDSNYVASFSGDCGNELRALTLSPGEQRSCTVTNTYVPAQGCPEGMTLSGNQCVATPTTNNPLSGGGGSSTFDYWGCTDKDATNFNSLANKDDGSCNVPPTITGGNGSGSSGDNASSTGEVLGASTTTPELSLPTGCTEYLHSYMRQGKKNDADEVSRLQSFLNETMGANIPVSGFFGVITRNWVKKFQVKYHGDIIKPWYDAGYKGKDIESGTGYVYKTTKREINLMKCSELNIPLPDLTPDL